ncbi:hypothetical protein IJD34_00240 [bacterium]|nr:hypothetical protein [bacterium]
MSSLFPTSENLSRIGVLDSDTTDNLYDEISNLGAPEELHSSLNVVKMVSTMSVSKPPEVTPIVMRKRALLERQKLKKSQEKVVEMLEETLSVQSMPIKFRKYMLTC